MQPIAVSPPATLTICICTMDRPTELLRCLQSIADGTEQPDAVVVSDDSPDGTVTAAICSAFNFATYVQGPRRGLCANRNNVVKHATTSHIALIDDDGIVSKTFVARACALAAEMPGDAILTGDQIEGGKRSGVPKSPSFWGHFTKPNGGGRLETISLNCNCFPKSAFEASQFDERIGFGYEDMDLCSQLLAKGFRIHYDPTLENTHAPPARTAAGWRKRMLETEKARFYTSVKRYWLLERNYALLAAYVLLAPVHRMAHAVKSRSWADFRNAVPDMVAAIRGVGGW